MKTDPWFYRFFRDLPEGAFGLAGLPKSKAKDYVFDAVELKEVGLRLDGVYRPNSAKDPFLFVEPHMYHSATFYLDWITKIVLFLRQEKDSSDFRALVLFETRSHEPTPSPWVREWIQSGRIQRVFHDELKEYPDITFEVAVLKLAAEKKETMLDRATRLAAQTRGSRKSAPNQKRLLGLIVTLLVANYPNLTRREIQKMLQMHDIRESVAVQEVFREGKVEGKLETIPLWIAKGYSVKELAGLLGIDEEAVKKAAMAPAQIKTQRKRSSKKP